MVKNFLNDENGAIVSIELVLIVTIAVLALIVGWSEVAVAVNSELNDISNAVGAMNQSYAYTGFKANTAAGADKNKSYFNGVTFNDSADDCDLNSNCSLVCGYSDTVTAEKGL